MAESDAPVKSAGSGERGWLIAREGLFELLGTAERVVHVSAPAGSGKTFLLRSWIAAEGLGDRVAWVSVGRGECDPQAFWVSVVEALRQTRAGSQLVRELTAAPGLDGVTVVDRLRDDLGLLDERLWLVIDDLHELQADQAMRDVERLLAGAPSLLRFVLVARRDLRLGLHRLRLEGDLTEIHGEDLRFTLEESRALLAAAGVRVSDGALRSLVSTTEGWVAGLRLAALSMVRDPEPERLAAGFSGRDRAVTEYLLAEVLERQPEEVSRLLLRTSILERVSGSLADRLTGGSGSERLLLELEDAGAFVVSLDPQRTWFRYHHLFADLLALELRRAASEEVPGLHTVAAQWWAEHGYPIDATRHAQAAENWGLAARLLADHWHSLYLDGRMATVVELLSGFPAEIVNRDPELAALAAAERRGVGSLHAAERYLATAERMSPSVPEERRGRFEVALALVRLTLARARNDLDAVTEHAQRMLTVANSAHALSGGLGDDGLRAMALIDLGAAEMWADRLQAAERHLDDGLQEARRIKRPWLELQALELSALLSYLRAEAIAEQRAQEAIELARAHGWELTASGAAAAYVTLGSVELWRGRLAEADGWLKRAELGLGGFSQPATELTLHVTRALLEFARGRHKRAMAAQRAAADIERDLATPHVLATRAHARTLELLVRAGEADRVQRAFDEMDEDVRATNWMQVVLASLRFAQDDPEGASAALEPVFAEASPFDNTRWEIQARLLQASIADALGDVGASSRALERALDLAEPDGVLLPFLLHPAPELLQRHLRLATTHAALISEVLNLLSGRAPASQPQDVEPLLEPLSNSELRVLGYLPTNLPAPEIAAELFVSLNTIRTHLRNTYAKLGVHNRADAVRRARELGLLSPSSLHR